MKADLRSQTLHSLNYRMINILLKEIILKEEYKELDNIVNNQLPQVIGINIL
jgi:hypothetical protein